MILLILHSAARSEFGKPRLLALPDHFSLIKELVIYAWPNFQAALAALMPLVVCSLLSRGQPQLLSIDSRQRWSDDRRFHATSPAICSARTMVLGNWSTLGSGRLAARSGMIAKDQLDCGIGIGRLRNPSQRRVFQQDALKLQKTVRTGLQRRHPRASRRAAPSRLRTSVLKLKPRSLA
jgi:hypothetical protein